MMVDWKAILAISPILVSCQMNKDAVTTQIGKDTAAYLEMITTDAEGNPNARIACTEGYHYAANLVADEMEKLGLEKFGDMNGTTYINMVPESVHEELCPHGMKNLIGVLRGSEYPDEYIILNGHLDGPNNYNPETQATIGNGNTTDAYDNGISVALGLAIAKQHIDNPPKRSILFIFDDGEEGWISVGTPKVGVYWRDTCYFSGKCSDEEREYYDRVKQTTCADMFCEENMFDYDENGVYSGNYFGYPMGTNCWVKNPTVDLNKVKAGIFLDSLGTPPGYSPIMSVLGGNTATYGTDGDTMNDFVKSIWPEDSVYSTFFSSKAPPPNYGSITSFSDYYDGLCEDNCVESGGIPGTWLVNLSFQRYHGGEDFKVTGQMPNFFMMLTEDYPDLKKQLNGKYPSPMYYSEDNMASMDFALLDDLCQTIEELLLGFANSDTTGELKYTREPINDPILQSVENTQVYSQMVYDGLSAAPDSFSSVMAPIAEDVVSRLNALVELDYADMTPEDYVELEKLSTYGVAFAQSLDFFNENYESKVRFADEYQYFDTPNEAPQTADDDKASPATRKNIVSLVSLFLTLLILQVFM